MIDELIDLVGDNNALAIGGAAIGVAFGALAQRSRFCLRSATLEIAHGEVGERMAIWLITFSTALIATQALILLGYLDTGTVRQLNNPGTLSGSIVGGLMFGCGMTLSRSCGSRMLVLSANGNLRALCSGLIFAVVAQMSRNGALAPLRSTIENWWTIDASSRDILAIFHMGHGGALLFSALWLAFGALVAVRLETSRWVWLASAGVGLMVAAAWVFNYAMSVRSFEPAPVHSLSFASPSADVLMYVLSPLGTPLSFDIALIPGVFVGSFLAAAVSGTLKLEGFRDGETMRRYLAGGCLMGFGAEMAGGCAIGAGVSGASVFSVTAWIVLWSMWIGAVLTDRLIDQEKFWAIGRFVS